ncbi:HTH-type transcriptional regulator srpR [Actinoplanes sp. SE50]|uniref:TetR/AcrR family transcriptional regulator n=1 Tax=unclassified Actinoplanes TaxID=2626549 RepID=UPI00023EBB38|nr:MULTISPECIES: TetR/AcrR family transcriptional regulator [unclassified Actinoplanes]AEV82878.1 HTH-type transcriptional regulator srpR [Actinoplanes sp. SE50/110]ATO81274.1 HTH-type transcriptional regulator srpR [Actinoplanes sp. SE50]SLL98681.1 TetR family transcriptional regulator [Actinoplanes sp. SE50/110]
MIPTSAAEAEPVGRRRGRPPDPHARSRILTAAETLLDEAGYLNVTIDEVATRAGVSKKTVYRFWPHKPALISDLIVERSAVLPVPDTGDTRRELATLFGMIIEYLTAGHGRTMALLVAATHDDPATLTRLREQVVAPRRDIARNVLQRGIARGDLPADVDVDALLDLWHGLVAYRISGRPAALHRHTVDQLVDLALTGHVPRLPQT